MNTINEQSTLFPGYIVLPDACGGEYLAQITMIDGQYTAQTSCGLVLARASDRDDCEAQARAASEALDALALDILHLTQRIVYRRRQRLINQKATNK